MSEISTTTTQNSDLQYYLQHHGVTKAESTTIKVRVVFNASFSSSNGNSLNNVQNKKPALQNELILLLQETFFSKYVFNADIQKIYRQILVDFKPRTFQIVLFRLDPNSDIKEYQIYTFDVDCAPYLAIRTMLKLAEDYIKCHPIASKILLESMCVDVGFHTIDGTFAAKTEIISMRQFP